MALVHCSTSQQTQFLPETSRRGLTVLTGCSVPNWKFRLGLCRSDVLSFASDDRGGGWAVGNSPLETASFSESSKEISIKFASLLSSFWSCLTSIVLKAAILVLEKSQPSKYKGTPKLSLLPLPLMPLLIMYAGCPPAIKRPCCSCFYFIAKFQDILSQNQAVLPAAWRPQTFLLKSDTD